jgi:hypothetical protein
LYNFYFTDTILVNRVQQQVWEKIKSFIGSNSLLDCRPKS